MAYDAKEPITPSIHSAPSEEARKVKVKWYRSTLYNAIILGICNFCQYTFDTRQDSRTAR
jgi:hypothetical protein